MKIAYQGMPGAYSEAAALERWGANLDLEPCNYLEDVFDSVEAGKADAGFVPVENTIEGSITRTYDLLNNRDLIIKGEFVFRVIHCLVANHGVKHHEIRRVYSHPQALGQTREFLSVHGYEPVAHFDTAGAAKMVRDEGARDIAAVASRRAAEIYDLDILTEGIETDRENYTRFLHIGYGEEQPTGNDRTSLAFTVDHRPGTLLTALRALASRKLNLTKIESRPLVGKPWEYVFFIDFEGHRLEPISADALMELGESSNSLKVLGSYPKA